MTKKRKKIIQSFPFLIICGIMLYSWGEFPFTKYIATWRHYLALGLVILNAILYFVRFREAIALTGAILIIATFNLLSFTTAINTFQLNFLRISTPDMQLSSLLLLILYGFLNFDFLIEWYLDYQEAKDINRHKK